MKRMKVSEIRPLYTDQIAMQDTSALEELETYKKKERKRKNQVSRRAIIAREMRLKSRVSEELSG